MNRAGRAGARVVVALVGGALAAGALAGCGNDGPVDLTGTYHVESHVASMCSTDQPVAMPVVYLRVASGAPYAMDACADAAGNGCTPFGAFPDPIDGGWRRGEASARVNTELAACALTFVEAIALLDDATLSVETTTYVDTIAGDSPLCTDAEAARRGVKMPCESHELIVATKVKVP